MTQHARGDLGPGEIAFDLYVLEAQEGKDFLEDYHVHLKLLPSAVPVAQPRAGIHDYQGRALEDAWPRRLFARGMYARQLDGAPSS